MEALGTGLIIGMIFGVLMGLSVGILNPKWYYDTIWFEINAEYEINVLDLLKHIKDMRVFRIPIALSRKEDGSLEAMGEKLFIQVRKSKWESGQMSPQEYLDYLVKKIEDADLCVLAKGLC